MFDFKRMTYFVWHQFYFILYLLSIFLNDICEVHNITFLYKYICVCVCVCAKKFEGLVREKVGEPSNVEIEDANGEDVAPHISLDDDAVLFYKVVGGSKKGRVYGLGSEGMVMAASQTPSFFPPQTPQLQPIVDDIMASPYFKKALVELLEEHDCEAAKRQHQPDQQMLQLWS